MNVLIEEKIIVISGPSGAGKTTLYKRIMEEMPGVLAFSVSCTTRPSRAGEKDGVDYYFLTEKDFHKKVDNEEFIEWEYVHNNYYGTLKNEVARIQADGHYCLMDLDVKGGMVIKKRHPAVNMIFIMPPSIDELRLRISKRKTDTEETINTRVQNAIGEIKLAYHYDYQIINDKLERAYLELRDVMTKITSK